MGVLTVVKITIAPRGLLPSFTDGQLVMFCYAVRMVSSTKEGSIVELTESYFA